MKKLVIVFAVVLSTIFMASAQTSYSSSSFSNAPHIKTSTYSTPTYSNYNSSISSGRGNYSVTQSYHTPGRVTTVNTTSSGFMNGNTISGTSVNSNGSFKSSSRTSTINFGNTQMKTTQYFDSNGNIKSSRTSSKVNGW
jgi:hypothetical protein